MEIAALNQMFIPGAMAAPPTNVANWIDIGLARLGRGAATRLANLLNLSPDKVAKMRHGERQPKATELPVIEQFLGEAAPMRSGRSTRIGTTAATVPIVGYVGAGASAYRYAVAQGDLDDVAAPAGATEKTVAVEIRGHSLGELFDRWVAFYDDVRTPITNDLIGKLCVVGLADERVLIKKVKRGKTPGLFDLISENAEPIRDVAVEWAARVKTMAPRN